MFDVQCGFVGLIGFNHQSFLSNLCDVNHTGSDVFTAAAAAAGVVMILLRFITVARRTNDACTRGLNISSLIIGSLSTVCLSLVANFPEDQTNGVGIVHDVGAGVVFTGGFVFMIVDTSVTIRLRHVEVRDADRPQTSLMRSVRWFEWIRPIIAVLTIIAWILCIFCYYSNTFTTWQNKINLRNTLP